MPETELGEVEGANEAVDRPNRIVQTDIVLDPGRKQTGLLAALAALERAIRHKPNRTCCSRKCPPFLPSLDVSKCFRRIRSRHRCQRPPCYFAWGCFRYFSWKREPRLAATTRGTSYDNLDFPVFEPIDTSNYAEFPLLDRGVEDRRRRFELRDIVDHILPNRGVEEIAGTSRSSINRGSDARNQGR